jgi:hypothetical protein
MTSLDRMERSVEIAVGEAQVLADERTWSRTASVVAHRGGAAS